MRKILCSVLTIQSDSKKEIIKGKNLRDFDRMEEKRNHPDYNKSARILGRVLEMLRDLLSLGLQLKLV